MSVTGSVVIPREEIDKLMQSEMSIMPEGVIHGHPEIPVVGEYRLNHDRLQRSNYLTLGGGVAFALTDSLGVFVDAAAMVWGENVHPLRGITIGLNAHFSTRR